MSFVLAYCFAADRRWISILQDASRSPGPQGLGLKYGLVGSPEWWDNVQVGAVPSGCWIGRVQEIVPNDPRGYPTITIANERGDQHTFGTVGREELYCINRPIMVFFLKLPRKEQRFDLGDSTQILSVWVDIEG